jgi:hypothetical protein
MRTNNLYVTSLILAALGGTTLVAPLAAAAERKARLTIEVKAQGTQAWKATAGEEEARPIYLNYFGFDNCGSQFHVAIDESSSGSYADVQGSVPFSTQRKADYRGNDVERRLICNGFSMVLDTEKKELWITGNVVPGGRGTTTYTDSLHGSQTSEAEMSLRGDIAKWVSEQMQRVPLSGTRKVNLPLNSNSGMYVPSADGGTKGTAQVELTWRFEEI